jgi:hypothetical protein
MLLGQIFSSIESWRKLSSVNMKPKIAYAILKYTALVSAEAEIVEKQRTALIYEATGAEPGTEVKLEPESPGWEKFVAGFNDILSQESTLGPIQMDMGEVIEALDGKDDVISVSDLARLEPFFAFGVECDESVAKVSAE